MTSDVLWEGNTAYGHYQITDTLYDGRPARVLYSGERQAAQSGVAKDDRPDLLFDYNQRMFELVSARQPGRLLLIGGAVGTLPTALLAALPDIRIDVVEPDEGLTRLAYRFFDLPVDDRLHIAHTDGRSFLGRTASRYDMILIDAFVHTTIPRDLRTDEAFQVFAAHLQDGGVLAMNVISAYHGKSSHVLRELCAATLGSFRTVEVFLAGRGYSLWLPQNFVLTAQKSTADPLGDYVRHEAVPLPDVRADEALHD